MTITAQTTGPSVALLGCGDIGVRVAERLLSQSYSVTALRRSAPNKALAALPISWRQCDLRDSEQLRQALPGAVDIALVTLAPSERSDRGYEQAYVDTAKVLCEHFRERPPKLLIFVSSTSVYGQNQGQLIDEGSPAEGSSFSASRLLQAEEIYRAANIPTVILRFSGIYGPGRHALLKRLAATQNTPVSVQHFSNRIHIEDCSGIIAHLIEQQHRGVELAPVYLANDSEPSPAKNLYPWLAQQLAIPTPYLTASDKATGKRCNNQLIKDSGYDFIYPSYRQGYLAIIEEFINKQAENHS